MKTRGVIFITGILFLILISVPAFAGTIDLPQTGQTKCYSGVSPYNEIPCAGTGQDGDIQAGVAWPSPRFTVGTGAEADCVTDNLTGLMWARNGNLANGGKTWQGALDYVAQLNSSGGLCGYTDWVLPNINELESLVNASEPNIASWLNTQGFTNVYSNGYWSSTTSAINTGLAWYVYMWNGFINNWTLNYNLFVLPVRSGQTGIIQIPKTGQTTSYYIGDDGDLERGASWPIPRFSVNGDCVTDSLTGLMWTKNANLPNGTKTWQEALNYTNSLTLCGHTDWRLPNIKELYSLIDHSHHTPALPTDYPFTNVQSNRYWAATTYAYNINKARYIYMWDGLVDNYDKNLNLYVWPVRGGETGPVGYYCDDDGDGYFDSSIDGACTGSSCVPAGCQTTAGVDCNDINPAINPGEIEICNDNIDNNCNGLMDDIAIVYYHDADGDGYGNSTEWILACPQPAGYVPDIGDCNDSNPAVHPGADDSNCNNIDEDCDGIPDEGYTPPSTTCGIGSCTSSGQLICQNGQIINTCTPGMPSAEVCDGLDNDCDGQINEGLLTIYHPDNDGDCQGDSLSVIQIGCGDVVCTGCGCPTLDDRDCNDNDAAIHVGATEVCNGLDDDCDWQIDEGIASTPTTCGVGACTSTGTLSCQGGHMVDTCIPGIPQTEIPNNGIDDDCNPATPVVSASGSGNNYPVSLFRASLSLNVNASSLGTSTLSYYYTRARLYFVSTSITGITSSGGTATITGTGTVNGVSGYTFTATITDGSPDSTGIVIYSPGGALYFSTGGTNPISTGNFTVVGQ